MDTQLLDKARQLTVDERIDLVTAIWDSIVEGEPPLTLTDAQREELDRRLSDHAAHPEEAVSWEQVKTEAHNRTRR